MNSLLKKEGLKESSVNLNHWEERERESGSTLLSDEPTHPGASSSAC